MAMEATLSRAAVAVLCTADPMTKADMALRVARAWHDRSIAEIGSTEPPDRPARPDRPALVPPRAVPRRRISAELHGRVALLHAIAHIELNAIDLAFDIVARFSHEDLPRPYYDDWVSVGADEARHFRMLSVRIAELGAEYGDFPAHDGLWEAAGGTMDDLLARLAIVPLVLEARGLDVTPAMIAKLRHAGDDDSADILEIIHEEEIRHVAAGVRWFRHICDKRALDPATTYRALVRQRFKGRLKPPFNRKSRDAAGLPTGFYEPLAVDTRLESTRGQRIAKAEH